MENFFCAVISTQIGLFPKLVFLSQYHVVFFVTWSFKFKLPVSLSVRDILIRDAK